MPTMPAAGLACTGHGNASMVLIFDPLQQMVGPLFAADHALARLGPIEQHVELGLREPNELAAERRPAGCGTNLGSRAKQILGQGPHFARWLVPQGRGTRGQHWRRGIGWPRGALLVHLLIHQGRCRYSKGLPGSSWRSRGRKQRQWRMWRAGALHRSDWRERHSRNGRSKALPNLSLHPGYLERGPQILQLLVITSRWRGGMV